MPSLPRFGVAESAVRDRYNSMATRREFIHISIAASALPFSRTASAAGANRTEENRPETSGRVWPLHRFIVDDRFPESAAAGRAAAQQGAVVHVMSGGDITPFWFHELSLRWKQEPAVIAGVTGHGPLFVLERFAWDHRMRVIVRAEHRRASNGSMTHDLSGPAHLISPVADLLTAGDWTAPMAVALTQCSLEPCSHANLVVTGPATTRAPENPDDIEPLFSWLIAPATQAI